MRVRMAAVWPPVLLRVSVIGQQGTTPWLNGPDAPYHEASAFFCTPAHRLVGILDSRQRIRSPEVPPSGAPFCLGTLFVLRPEPNRVWQEDGWGPAHLGGLLVAMYGEFILQAQTAGRYPTREMWDALFEAVW